MKIHTNIDDNFEIHSSEESSIISRIQEDTEVDNTQNITSENFQATGETCIIICDENSKSKPMEGISNDNTEFHVFKRNTKEILEENTVIVHQNVPSTDIIDLDNLSKPSEDF